jgi:hypothetical protein
VDIAGQCARSYANATTQRRDDGQGDGDGDGDEDEDEARKLGHVGTGEQSQPIERVLRETLKGLRMRGDCQIDSRIELETFAQSPKKPCELAWTTGVFRGLLVRSHALS